MNKELSNHKNIENLKPTSNKTNRDLFTKRIMKLNALSCSVNLNNKNDIDNAEIESKLGLEALNDKNGIQEMLAAQMLSIHQLQQTSMCLANATNDISTKQYFTNTSIKLANTFVQQASLLSKLQGGTEQKVIVKNIELNDESKKTL